MFIFDKFFILLKILKIHTVFCHFFLYTINNQGASIPLHSILGGVFYGN